MDSISSYGLESAPIIRDTSDFPVTPKWFILSTSSSELIILPFVEKKTL